jgi:hypothetical protein
MTDEREGQTPEVVTPEVPLSDAEAKARAGGWVPKEEWTGVEDEWVDYREFNFRGELMERIQNQTKALKKSDKVVGELKQAIKALGEHNAKIAEMQYERAMRALRKEKANAITEGDSDKIAEIEENIDKLNAAKANSKFDFDITEEPEQHATPNPEFLSWQAKPENNWYGRDIPMTATADALAVQFAQTRDGNYTPRELLEYVDKQLRKEFPHKFGSSAGRVSESNTTGTPRSRGKKFGARDLNEEQRAIGRRFVEAGAFKDIQEYVDQLADLGEIPSQKGA